MYCSSCGTAAVQDLSYCNRCGAKVGGANAVGDRPSELSPNSLLKAIGGVFFVGLAAFVALIALMKDGAGFIPVVLAAAVLSFALTFVVEAVLLWLLLRGRRVASEAGGNVRPKGQTTKELGEARARELPEPMPSVTEHTTRAFDPVLVERKSK
jgi:hypothetical protein